MSPFPEELCDNFGQLYAAAYCHKIYVLGWTPEEKVAHTSPYGIAGAAD